MPNKRAAPFYGLSESERVALTEAAMAKRETVLNRWTALSASEAAPWAVRAAKAAERLAGRRSVADFGCGTMGLELLLDDGVGYVPVDVTRRDTRTLLCDFNREVPPATGAEAAACLGLLEYLYDPQAFLAALHRAGFQLVVVSYCIADAPAAPAERRAHAWVNDLTLSEAEALFVRTGWHPTDPADLDGLQMMWTLARAPQDVPSF